MSSARLVVLSICASLAALGALALTAQGATPGAATSTIALSVASNHNFQHAIPLNSVNYAGPIEAPVAVFANGPQAAAAVTGQAGASPSSVQSRVTPGLDQFTDRALRRGRRGVGTSEF